MKIYNSVTMDWEGNIIEEDSYGYDGIVLECKGDVSVPPPTSEEIEIQREQLAILRENRELQQQLMPYMMETAGYTYKDGKITKMSPDEYLESLDPVMKQQYQNMLTIQEQTAKALKGELDVSPGLERNLESQEAAMQENLSRRLGSNWGLSSAGITSQQEFNAGAESLREQARHGALQTYGTLGMGGSDQWDLTPQGQASSMGGLGQYGTNMVSTYGSALQPYQMQRKMQLQANMQTEQNKAKTSSAMWGALGNIVGIGTGAWLGKA